MTESPFEKKTENTPINTNRNYGSSRMLFSEFIESREKLNNIMSTKPNTSRNLASNNKPPANQWPTRPTPSLITTKEGKASAIIMKSFDKAPSTPLTLASRRNSQIGFENPIKSPISKYATRFTKKVDKPLLAKELLFYLKKLASTRNSILGADYKKLFPTNEYQLSKTRKFIDCIRKNDLSTAKALLAEEPHLVYQYDTVS